MINNSSSSSDKINNKNEYTMLSFIILAFIFIFQYSSKVEDIKKNLILSNDISKKSQIDSTNYIFWKYLILSQLTQGIFLTINIKNNSLNIYSFIISIISCFLFLLFFGKKICDKNKGIFIYGILLLFLSIYSVLINNNIINLYNYYILQIICKICEIFMNIIYINNFEIECNNLIDDNQIKNNLINNYIEKNELIGIFSKITFQFINYNLDKSTFFQSVKINSPSKTLPILFSLLIILIYYYWNKSEKNIKDEDEEKTKDNNNYKLLILIAIGELFINIIYHLYQYNVIDFLRNKKPEMNNYHLYNLFIPSLLVGITSFRILYSFYGANISSISKINALLFTIGISLVQFYKDFNKNLYGALFIESSFGLYSVLYKRIIIYGLQNYLIYKKIMIWFYYEVIKLLGELIIIKYNYLIQKPIFLCFILSCIYFCIQYFFSGDIIIKNNENDVINIKKENSKNDKNKKKKD